MDLEPLKIERGEKTARKRRGGGRSWGWIVFVALLAIGVWIFRSPIFAFVDRLRLPTVAVTRVIKTSPLTASAVSGTAASGYVVASRKAALSADTPGRIVEMNVIEGSIVKKGQVIARLYSDEYAAALRHAEADLESAKSSVEAAKARTDARSADLARLKAIVEQVSSSLAQAKTSSALAEVKFERASKLLDEKIGTQQEFDDAKAALDNARSVESAAASAIASAKASLAQGESEVAAAQAAVAESASRIAVLAAVRDQAKATLDKTEVRAPFDGIVVLKDAEVGEVVSPNSQGGNSRGSVATMVDWSSLEVEVELPETNLSAARIGDAANIYLDAYPEHLYPGKVLRIWPTANRQKATVEVRVGFEKTDDKLRPEMGARVVFSPSQPAEADPSAKSEPSILIPRAALLRSDSTDCVFVLERDVVRLRKVRLGEARGDRVQAIDGVNDGEMIVLDPSPSLSDGDHVRIRE